nr:amino acid permease [Verrucomicrobiota bacterium]
GLLPQYFARLHPKYRTPYITTIWTGVVVGGVAMFTDIGSLADLTNIGTLFAFSLVCIGVILLRKTDPNRKRPFRVPLVPLLPILGVIMCMALMLSLPILTWLRFFAWLIIGMVIYFLYSVRHSRLQHGIDTGDSEDILPPPIKPR